MNQRSVRVGWMWATLFFLSACASPVKESVKTQGLDLTLVVVSPLEVALFWNEVEGVKDYRLERKATDEAFVVLKTLQEQTNYLDNTVEQGKTYTYRVSALAEGKPTESAEASTENPGVPPQPSPTNPDVPAEPTTPAPTPKPTSLFLLSATPWSYANDKTGEPKKNSNSAGGPLSVAGQTFQEGLSTRLEGGINSEMVYALSGNCTTFSAKVGIDDASQGEAVFQIFADGLKLWDSGIVKTGGTPKATGDVNITNKGQLVLVVQPSSSLHTQPAPTPPTTPPTPDPTQPAPSPTPQPTPTPTPTPTSQPVFANWLEASLTCASQPMAADEKAFKGEWAAPFDWQGLVATHVANLPDGRILSWSSWDKTKQGGTPTDFKENTTGYLWNPTDSSFVEMNNPRHDMFCAGLAILPNGDVFAGGGGNETNLYKTSVFEVANTMYQWRAGPRMVRDHWYGTAVALPDGGVVMSMGSDTAWNSTELLADGTSTTAQWRLLGGADTGPVVATTGTPTSDIPNAGPEGKEYEVAGWYPYLSVAPSGKLFDAGPVPRLYEFDVTGTGKVTQVGTRADQMRTWGTSVMYDEGKILVTGGARIRGLGATNTAVSISMKETGLEVKNAAPMSFQRAFQSGVMLPTGDVLMVGGNTTGKQFTSEAAVLEAEVWNPTTNTWRTLAAEARPRAYHSAALLLPDGRVLATGGGLCGRAGCAAGIDEPNGEIFSPPYLFNPDGTTAVRPVISSAPERIDYNQTFSVNVTGRDITKFSLIKLSAITHGVNTDLRYLSVPFVKGEGGSYSLTSHENANVLTPGYYFLFAVDDKGVPSVSKTILVAR